MDVFEAAFLLVILMAPGIFASLIQEWLKPTRCSALRYAARAAVYTGVISLLTCALYVLRGHAAGTLSALLSSLGGILKYGVASFVISLVLPSAFVLAQILLNRLLKKQNP